MNPRYVRNAIGSQNATTDKKIFCVFAPPVVSDTAAATENLQEYCGHGFKSYESFKGSEFGESLGRRALEIIGCLIARICNWPTKNSTSALLSNILPFLLETNDVEAPSYTMKALPAGYSLYIKWEQNMAEPVYHFAGHPSGKCFSSLQDFVHHTLWLHGAEDMRENNCDCALCLANPKEGQTALLNDHEPNIDGPQFPMASNSPLYHPFGMNAGAETFLELLGPAVTQHGINTAGSGASLKSRRGPPPAIQVNIANAHSNGAHSAPSDCSTGTYGPQTVDRSGTFATAQTPVYPASPLVISSAGVLHGHNASSQLSYNAAIQTIISERNAHLLRVNICNEQIHLIVNRMHHAGLVSPFTTSSSLLQPQQIQSVNMPSKNVQNFRQTFPPNVNTTNQHAVPQHRPSRPAGVPPFGHTQANDAAFMRAHAATAPMYKAMAHTAGSASRHKARTTASCKSPTFRNTSASKQVIKDKPSGRVTKAAKVKKALASVSKKSPEEIKNIVTTVENSFEQALANGNGRVDSEESHDEAVEQEHGHDEADLEAEVANASVATMDVSQVIHKEAIADYAV